MKIRHATIENFRGISKLNLDFCGPSDAGPRQTTLLLGDNGSGKTSALQAIALTLSLATGRTERAEAFNWRGFLAERTSTLGSTRVQLTLTLDEEEASTAARLFAESRANLPKAVDDLARDVLQGGHEIEILFESGRVSCGQGEMALERLKGRHYARTRPQRFEQEMARRVGDVFWFDQDRNVSSAGTERKGSTPVAARDLTWQTGVEQLRENLMWWWSYHRSDDKSEVKDYIPELERRFADLFPGTRFKGTRPKGRDSEGGASDFYFLLERDGKEFDIAEMSSGEQAIFPLLYEFVRQDIAKSVVLIDELELHLHPPQQQALLSALPRIGPDCQYIITSHSPYVEQVVPDEWEVRLEGGRQCL